MNRAQENKSIKPAKQQQQKVLQLLALPNGISSQNIYIALKRFLIRQASSKLKLLNAFPSSREFALLVYARLAFDAFFPSSACFQESEKKKLPSMEMLLLLGNVIWH